MVRSYFLHDNWLEDQADKGVPLYKDCYVDDLRTLKLGHWDIRGCDTAFIQFTNMNGVTEARVQEIPAGESLKPIKLGVDELVYVLQGRGFVIPQDIKTIGPDILRHRIILSYEAEAENITSDEIIQKIRKTGL